MIKLRQLINELRQPYREVTMYATYIADSPANHRGTIDNPIDKGMTLDIKLPFNPPYNGSLGKGNKVIYCAPIKWIFNDENENVDLIHIKFKVSLDNLFIDKEEFHYWKETNMYDELKKIDWDQIETYADLVSKGIKFNNPWDIAGCYVKTIKPEQILDIIFQLTRTKYFKEGGNKNKKQKDFQKIQEYIKKGNEGYLDLGKSHLTKLPDNLIRVEGHLSISDSHIEDLNNLEYVGGDLWVDNSRLKSLSKLTRTNGSLHLSRCLIDNLDSLEYVGGDLYIGGTNISELPEGLEIKGSLHCWDTPLLRRFPDESLFREYLKERNITIRGKIRK